MSEHMKYREKPTCIKCGYHGMDYTFIDGNVEQHKYEYVLITCNRCKFEASMDCKDTVKIKSFDKQLEKDMKEVEDKGGIKWLPDQN